jgi:hypothetical protein
MRYWVNTISREHVVKGTEGGFTQANHGKPDGLRRVGRGDYIVFYSPREGFRSGEKLQSFTAIAKVTDDEPYQHADAWRRKVEFLPVAATAIQPLIEQLEFIRDKKQWGWIFRRGFFEIGGADFERIATAMSVGEPAVPAAVAERLAR